MQIILPTPTSVPPAELVKQAGEIVSIWNSLGPLMAVLLLAAIALGIVAFMTWVNRNSSSSAINVLVAANAQKDRELTIQREQEQQRHNQFIESLSAIVVQTNRSNDLVEQGNVILTAVNEFGIKRDIAQKQIAADIHQMVNSGSAPVQEIRARVNEIVGIVSTIDGRTADWNGILTIITPLLIELGALRTEAKKHSTQPIVIIPPIIDGIETSQPTVTD